MLQIVSEFMGSIYGDIIANLKGRSVEKWEVAVI